MITYLECKFSFIFQPALTLILGYLGLGFPIEALDEMYRFMMDLLSRMFKSKKDQRGAKETVSDYDTLVELYKVDDETRMRKIIDWCEKVDNSKLNVVQYAILHDSDLGVKMAGLKRIHLFADKVAVREFLKDEMTLSVGRKCEPYFSMALSKAGLISFDDFERRMNGQLVK